MRKRIAVLSVATAMLAAVAEFPSTSGASSAPISPTSSPAASYLFSIPASSGSLTGADDRHLVLHLTGGRPYITRFTNIPLHSAEIIASSSFAAGFVQTFPNEPPNAVLTYTPTGQTIPLSIIVEVSHPRWNANARTWTFQAIRLRKTSTTAGLTPPAIPNPSSFQSGTLVIDSSSSLVTTYLSSAMSSAQQLTQSPPFQINPVASIQSLLAGANCGNVKRFGDQALEAWAYWRNSLSTVGNTAALWSVILSDIWEVAGALGCSAGPV